MGRYRLSIFDFRRFATIARDHIGACGRAVAATQRQPSDYTHHLASKRQIPAFRPRSGAPSVATAQRNSALASSPRAASHFQQFAQRIACDRDAVARFTIPEDKVEKSSPSPRNDDCATAQSVHRAIRLVSQNPCLFIADSPRPPPPALRRLSEPDRASGRSG